MCQCGWKKNAEYPSARWPSIAGAFCIMILGAMTAPCLSAGEDERPWEWLQGEEKNRVFEELTAQWDAQRTAIASAHLKFRLIRTKTQPVPRKEFVELLESLELTSQPDNLTTLSDRVLIPLKGSQSRSGAWGELELWQEGDQVREQEVGKGSGWIGMAMQEATLTYDSSKQATIYAAGDTAAPLVASAGSYCFIPKIAPKFTTTLGRLNGQILVRYTVPAGYRIEITVDAASAMALNRKLYSPEADLMEEYIQRGFATYPGGVVFPSLHVEAKYSGGSLQNLLAAVMTDVTFNEDVSKDKFKLAVPSGAVVVDTRASPAFVERLTGDTDDVLDSVAQRKAQMPKTPAACSRWMLVLGSLLLMAILIIAMFARRRFKSAS